MFLVCKHPAKRFQPSFSIISDKSPDISDTSRISDKQEVVGKTTRGGQVVLPHICIATRVRKRYMVVKVLNGFEKIASFSSSVELQKESKKKIPWLITPYYY